MSRLDDLYELRARIEEQINLEVCRLEAEAKRERARFKESVERRGWAECGTDGGYYRHRRTMRETACDLCKAAHRKAEQQRKERREAADATSRGLTVVRGDGA